MDARDSTHTKAAPDAAISNQPTANGAIARAPRAAGSNIIEKEGAAAAMAREPATGIIEMALVTSPGGGRWRSAMREGGGAPWRKVEEGGGRWQKVEEAGRSWEKLGGSWEEAGRQPGGRAHLQVAAAVALGVVSDP